MGRADLCALDCLQEVLYDITQLLAFAVFPSNHLVFLLHHEDCPHHCRPPVLVDNGGVGATVLRRTLYEILQHILVSCPPQHTHANSKGEKIGNVGEQEKTTRLKSTIARELLLFKTGSETTRRLVWVWTSHCSPVYRC